MLNLIKNWKGDIYINEELVSSSDIADKGLKSGDKVNIRLISRQRKTPLKVAQIECIITVKPYMTLKSRPEFDFMQKWNNDIPMPLRTMSGVVVKETKGMVYMKLHGGIFEDRTLRCMKCGRPITNPVSQYFGMGPECGGHNYVNPFPSNLELRAAVEEYRSKLQNVIWEGWIPKTAIISKREVNSNE